jgi:hypothetical protein
MKYTNKEKIKLWQTVFFEPSRRPYPEDEEPNPPIDGPDITPFLTTNKEVLKTIEISNSKQKKKIREKPKQKRVVTKEKKWIYESNDYSKENQKHILRTMLACCMQNADINVEVDVDNIDNVDASNITISVYPEPEREPDEREPNTYMYLFYQHYQRKTNRQELTFLQEVNKKIYGYKRQDLEKGKYDAPHFIRFSFVLRKLDESNLQCYYCHEQINILYENVREPKQWTFDRIDNEKGHNIDNVEVSCLTCNLRRKTIFYQRYLLTKQLNHIIKTNI